MISGCAKTLPVKSDTPITYKGFGKIEIDTSTELFAGDFAFSGNDKEFSIEVYHLGINIFKADEKNGKVVYYYMGNQYDEESINHNFISVKFSNLKDMLIDLTLGKDIDINDGSLVARSELSKTGKLLYLYLQGSGKIKISLQNE